MRTVSAVNGWLMGRSLLRVFLVFGCVCCLGTRVFPQEVPLENPRRGGDPNNAGIEGHIVLPSGQAAEFNIKVILSDLRRPLNSLYTDKHAEFRFLNLSEGEYYIQVIADEKRFEPVTQTVRLARSQVAMLTINLRNKEMIATRGPGAAMVSTSELSQTVPDAARKEFIQGVKLAEKGDLAGAIEHLRRAVVIYPEYTAAHNNLGAQYLKRKELDLATEHFRLALRNDPKYFNSVFNLALVMLERHEHLSAIAQLNQAIAIDSSRAAPHMFMGIALIDVNELPGAERALSKALILGGTDYAVAHYYLAQVHLKNKSEEQAKTSLKAYLQEAPKGEFAGEAKDLLSRLSGRGPLAK